MKTGWLGRKQDYDGTQLRPLFAYMETGMLGNSCVCFEGACSISFDHMVDGEDVRNQSPIRGGHMLHFIMEFFHQNLFSAVAFQRLTADLVRETVEEMTEGRIRLTRSGDDLYFEGDRKFSISIASVSATSQMIHFAVNVSNEGTPVKTSALVDFGLNTKSFGDLAMEKISKEFTSILEATQKVKPL